MQYIQKIIVAPVMTINNFKICILKKTQIIHKYIKVKNSLTSLASSGSSDRAFVLLLERIL